MRWCNCHLNYVVPILRMGARRDILHRHASTVDSSLREERRAWASRFRILYNGQMHDYIRTSSFG